MRWSAISAFRGCGERLGTVLLDAEDATGLEHIKRGPEYRSKRVPGLSMSQSCALRKVSTMSAEFAGAESHLLWADRTG
jgi:hypothetical protein